MFLKRRTSSTETPSTDTNITGWWDDRPSTSVLGSTYATKRAWFSVKITVRVHAGVVVVLHRRSQIDEMTQEETAQSVTVPCKSRAKRSNLGSAELDEKQVSDRQKLCAPHAGVYMRTL